MKHLFTLLSFFILHTSFSQNAIDFDGTNDYVQTSFPGVIGDADRTFEAWIYVNPGAGGTLCIMDYGLNVAGGRNTLIVAPDRSIRYLCGGGSVVAPADVIIEGEWIHVAFVLEAGDGYLYVNGVEVMTSDLSVVDTPAGEDLIIGQRVTGGSIPFNGAIDEVRIWDVARTSDEILANMNTELCPPVGLVAYYKFNEGEADGDNTDVDIAPEEIAGNDGELIYFELTGETSNWVLGVDLEVIPSYSITNTFTECDGFSITVGGSTYTTTGIYTDVFPGVLVCDSTIITDLTILPEAVNDIVTTECVGYSITLNDVTYDETGFYTDTLVGMSENDCDSIITLDLTILQEGINNIIHSGCYPYSVTVNDITYDETGVYADTIPGGNFEGCDSIINIALIITGPIDITTTAADNIITANSEVGTYQWIDCNTMTAIDGETEQSLSITESGDYAVVVTVGECSDTSECFPAYLGVEEMIGQSSLTIYPNPASDFITVKTNNSGSYSVTIYDLLGKTYTGQLFFENSVEIDVQNLPNGTYIVEVVQNGNIERNFFVKQ